MAIFHLSHTDLDGYGAQFVTNFYFDNIKFFNSNYGKEINEKFAQILNLIDTEFANETNLILITDLNLTLSQCLEFKNLAGEKNAKIYNKKLKNKFLHFFLQGLNMKYYLFLN